MLLRYLYKRLNHILPLEELEDELAATNTPLANANSSTISSTNGGGANGSSHGSNAGIGSSATIGARSTLDDPYRLDELLKMHHMDASS